MCLRHTCIVLLVFTTFSHMSMEYNSILSWDVCSPSRIIVTLTGGADGGIIYVKGYGSACRQGISSNSTVHEFVFSARGIEQASQCNSDSTTYSGWGRRRRNLDVDDVIEEVNVGTSLSVGTEIYIKPKDAKDSVCINTIALIAAFVAAFIVVVTSMGLATWSTTAMLRRSDKVHKLNYRLKNIGHQKDTGEGNDCSIVNSQRRNSSVAVIYTNPGGISIKKQENELPKGQNSESTSSKFYES